MSREISNLQSLRTACKIKLHSKPKLEGEEYLRMYLAQKEDLRLVRYRKTLANSIEQTEESAVQLADEMDELKREVAKDLGVEIPASAEPSGRPYGRNTRRLKPSKPFTKMSLDY